jgi:hypothetical protein
MVLNHLSKFSFIVPKDIAYNIDAGKISYYAENGLIDAKGEFTNVLIGGTDPYADIDDEGPEIELYLNDERFEDGGMTNPEPYIHALLYDLHGINTSGSGIGHDITAVLDEDDPNPYILNDYFVADIDDYQRGRVRYQLSEIEKGEHSLMLKAWDVYNNSSEAMIGFVVDVSDGLVIETIINYPNPAVESTNFQYTHNVPDEEHDIVLEVFDISGRLITRVEQKQFESGFVSSPIYWDLRNSNGDLLSPGIYPYRLKVTTPLGTGYINQKLIIIR